MWHLLNFLGTMGPESSEGIPPNLGALYSLERDRTPLKKHLSPISVSNGLAWSADNRTMYYIDSAPRQIYSFDFDLESGILGQCLDVMF